MNAAGHDCSTEMQRLHEWLDGAAPQPAEPPCPECRANLAAARQLQAFASPVPPLPVGFADRVLIRCRSEVQSDQRRRMLARVAAPVLAASVLAAVWLLWPEPRGPEPQPVAQQGVEKPLREARQALASLTDTVAAQALAPATELLASNTPSQAAEMQAEDPLGDLADAARAGFEPLVNAPRRAIDRLIRDMNGLAMNRPTEP